MDVAGAVAHFEKQLGALAVPCNTVKEIAAICSDDLSTSARFTKKDSGCGWIVETWEPTWFCLDGQPLTCPRHPTYAGSDAPEVLAELGYSQGEILGLKQSRAVVPTNWYKWADEEAAPVPIYSPDDLLKEGLE